MGGTGQYRTAPHLNTLCLSANCFPEKSSRRCVGGFYGLRGASHKLSRSHPATKFDCGALVPGGSSHSGRDVVVALFGFFFFWYTNTIWQKASVSSLGASGASNTGMTEQILEHLLFEIWLHASSSPPRSRRHAGRRLRRCETLSVSCLEQNNQHLHSCKYCHAKRILLKNSTTEEARCQCGGVCGVCLTVCELPLNFQCIFGFSCVSFFH